MTLKELAELDSEILTPTQVAPILGVNPQTIRINARERPELLGFPVICAGRRVKIPKAAFVRFMKGESA